jgi:hypothetical protein
MCNMLHLLLLVFTVCRACQTHTLAVHHEEDEGIRKQIIEPILNSAILISRDITLPLELRFEFAHRLMRIYDKFSHDCIDSGWKHAVAHKLCATFIRWDDLILKQERLTRDSACSLSAVVHLLRACRSHVEPWAHDADYCQAIPEHCADKNPFWGACRLWRTKTRSLRYGNEISSHQRHDTKHKHNSHGIREKIDGHERTRSHMADRLRHSSSSSASINKSDESRIVRIAILYDKAHRSWDIRKCAARLVCAPRNMTALVKLWKQWLPECDIRIVDKPYVLRIINGECAALISWSPYAEHIMRAPCDGLSRHSSSNAIVGDYIKDCTSPKKPANSRSWVWEPNDHMYLFNSSDVSEFQNAQSVVCLAHPEIHSTKLISCI